MSDQQKTEGFGGQVALITGANRGIGLELARQLKERGARVIGAHRRERSEALAGAGVEQISRVDVCSHEAPERLRSGLAELGVTRLDLLINNAGLLIADQLDALDFHDIQQQLEVNALGPLRVTEALRAQLAEGGKVAQITSRMGSIEDNDSGAYYGYRASKAALNAFTKSLAIDLKSQGVSVFALHPGFVKTDMTGGRGLITPQQSAEGLIAQIERLGVDESGTFWHMDGSPLPW